MPRPQRKPQAGRGGPRRNAGLSEKQVHMDADEEPSGTSRDISKIDKTIMDNFYKLVHTQPSVRLTAAASTFKILVGMRNNKSPRFNEHLNYCVERLVTGLASARAFARKGYATLLLEILKKNQVSMERLFTLAQQKYGNISNETSKDNLLGYFLLINVVLESGTHSKTKQNSAYIEKMYKILRQLTDHKSYFDYSVAKLLSERNEIFYEHMLGEIPPAAFSSDIHLTHTELLSIALCNKHKPLAQAKELSSNDIMRMSEALCAERLKRRPLHPVWIEWSNFVLDSYPSISQRYITEVIHKNFFKANHNELASMGFELIGKLITNLQDHKLVDVLLSDYIVRLLITSLRSKNSLHKHCVQFINTISESFKEKLDVSAHSFLIQVHIVERFLKPPGSLAFDEDSKSQTLMILLNHCSKIALVNLSNLLLEKLGAKMSPADSKRLLPAVGRLLAHIIRRPQMAVRLGSDCSLDLAKTLMVNSLFAFVDPLAKDKKFWSNLPMPPEQPLDPSVRASLRSAYHAAMDNIVSSSDAPKRIESMGTLVDLCHQLIHPGAVGFSESTGDITKLWQHYMVSLLEYRKLCEANKDPKILYPISSLYLLYGLQIVEHGLNCREQLDDLYKAAQDALENDPNDGSWADILTDQIIAILSATECSPWMRKLCVSVFGSLLPHISESSIELLCDAIRAPIESNACDEDDDDCCSEDHELSVDGDAEGDGRLAATRDKSECESDEEEEEGIDFTDGSDSDDDDSQSDAGVSDQENNESGESDTKSKNATDKGVPMAIDNKESEEEESDEELMDDDEMLKRDELLAAAVKSILDDKKRRKRKRDPSFKLRCLDLIKKVLAKKHNDTEVTKRILSTIIPLAAKSRKSADTRPIADKINSMIAKMPGKSKLDIPGLMNRGKRNSRNASSADDEATVDDNEDVIDEDDDSDDDDDGMDDEEDVDEDNADQDRE